MSYVSNIQCDACETVNSHRELASADRLGAGRVEIALYRPDPRAATQVISVDFCPKHDQMTLQEAQAIAARKYQAEKR